MDREDDRQAKPAGRSPWIALVPVMAIGLGVAFYLGKSSSVQPAQPVAAPAVDAAAPIAVRPAEIAIPAVLPDARQPAAVAVPTKGPVKPVAPTPNPTPPPRPAAAGAGTRMAVLDISVEPAVNVAVDGKPAGRTPLRAEVKPGVHRLAFTDPAQGISIVKNVKARAGTNSISFSIGRGSVSVSCPPGAEVRIDNRVVGTTPLKGAVPVVEGSHRISVSKGGAKWQQVFEVGDGERMDFEVEISGD